MRPLLLSINAYGALVAQQDFDLECDCAAKVELILTPNSFLNKILYRLKFIYPTPVIMELTTEGGYRTLTPEKQNDKYAAKYIAYTGLKTGPGSIKAAMDPDMLNRWNIAVRILELGN